MRSYILAIAMTMFLSALYAFQNLGDVTVRFLFFEWVFPQGVWDVLLFAGGAVLMWVFSLFSGMETKGKYKKIIKEKDDKITAIEKEKATLLETLTASRRNMEEYMSAPAQPTAPVQAARENTLEEAADTTGTAG